MTLSELQNLLTQVDQVRFQLPDGSFVPAHYHLTEVGLLQKRFMDCGGKERAEASISLQLWYADDTEHRLQPEKFSHILSQAQTQLQLPDASIEVEYQADTIAKFGLDYDGTNFVLTKRFTDCLAKESCGVPETGFVSLATAESSCTPGGGCC